ncbi:MAG: hypothetical protein KF684_13025 [Phycisphaeraceae bacterium]|nr:hypothetical protein [Phycisphaeraceae bacterium]
MQRLFLSALLGGTILFTSGFAIASWLEPPSERRSFAPPLGDQTPRVITADPALGEEGIGIGMVISDGLLLARATRPSASPSSWIALFRRVENDWVRIGEVHPPAQTTTFASSFVVSPGGLLARSQFGQSNRLQIFERDGDSLTFLSVLPLPPVATLDFGRAAAVSDDLSLIAIGDPAFFGSRGRLCIYERDGNSFTLKETISHPLATQPDSRFGWPVAIDGDRVLVGSRIAQNVPHPIAGAIHVYERVDGVWTEVGQITSPAGQVTALDAPALLAIAGDDMVVSSPDQNFTTVGAPELRGFGSVLALRRINGEWSQPQFIRPLDPLPNPQQFGNQFGHAIAIHDDSMFIKHESMQPGVSASVLRYRRGADRWMQAERLDITAQNPSTLLAHLAAGESGLAVSGLPGFGPAIVWMFETPVAPALPSGFALVSPPDGALAPRGAQTFTWTQPFEAETAVLRIARDAGFTDIVVSLPLHATELHASVMTAGLPPGERLFWSVFAGNDLGETSAGNGPRSFVTLPAGDANGDCAVNFADLNTVLSAFGQSGPGLPGDVNDDGVVNFADLNMVLANFGASCD